MPHKKGIRNEKTKIIINKIAKNSGGPIEFLSSFKRPFL